MTIVPDDKFDQYVSVFQDLIRTSITDLADGLNLIPPGVDRRTFLDADVYDFTINVMLFKLDIWPERSNDLESFLPATMVTPGGSGVH